MNGVDSALRGPSAASGGTGGIEGGLSVLALPLTTSPARFQIPASFVGHLCRVSAAGGNAQFLMGTSAVAITKDTTNTVTSEAVALNNAIGDYLADGQSDKFELDPAATHISAVGSATCRLYIRVITQR